MPYCVSIPHYVTDINQQGWGFHSAKAYLHRPVLPYHPSSRRETTRLVFTSTRGTRTSRREHKKECKKIGASQTRTIQTPCSACPPPCRFGVIARIRPNQTGQPSENSEDTPFGSTPGDFAPGGETQQWNAGALAAVLRCGFEFRETRRMFQSWGVTLSELDRYTRPCQICGSLQVGYPVGV